MKFGHATVGKFKREQVTVIAVVLAYLTSFEETDFGGGDGA
jgi:hypothetical protein